MEVQLDLFQDMTETGLLKAEVASLREELGNTRRGAFARLADLGVMILELRKEVEQLRENAKKD